MFVIFIDLYYRKINPFFWKPQLNKTVSFYVLIVPFTLIKRNHFSNNIYIIIDHIQSDTIVLFFNF